MSFFDGSARVPLIAAGPGIAPARHAGPVSQVDLAPTLAELAAVGGDDAEYEGTSLAPLLRGGAAGGPDWVAGEYLAEGVRAPSVMLRRGRHKFIRTPGDPDQLYDLDADRLELDNLAGDPAHAAVVEEMGAEVRRRWDLEALDAEVRESQRRRRLVAAGLRHGAQTPWDHQPFVDASVQWVRGERAGAEHPSRLRPRGDLPERE
jgi:choline-sulfatase